MDLNAAKMFVAVVQAGTLSAAAQRTGIPLATLSRRIRELERELKADLLDRSVRGVRPTQAGARLYEHARRGVEALMEGAQAVASDQIRLKGRLRLSLPTAFEPWWELLSAFQQHYPGIELHVHMAERRCDRIEDDIDVALRVGPIAHDTMVARLVLSYRHVLAASPALIQRLGPPRRPEDLAAYPCAVWGPADDSQWRLGDTVVRPQPVLATNDYAYLRNRVLAGEVVAELPPFLAAPAVREGRMLALLTDHPMQVRQVNLLYRSRRNPSAIVRAYLDFCLSRWAHFIDLNGLP